VLFWAKAVLLHTQTRPNIFTEPKSSKIAVARAILGGFELYFAQFVLFFGVIKATYTCQVFFKKNFK
jgi:hypothetical protein